MPLSFYDVERESLVEPDYIVVYSIKATGEKETIEIHNSNLIMEALEYLRSVPLVYTYKSEEKLRSNNESEVLFLEFYNEQGITLGWIKIYGDRYILCGINMQIYMIKNDEDFLLSRIRDLLNFK